MTLTGHLAMVGAAAVVLLGREESDACVLIMMMC